MEVGGPNTDLAVLLWVLLHPHPGQVDLRQTDGQLEPLWSQDLIGQHAHHRFAVGSLKDQRNTRVSDAEFSPILHDGIPATLIFTL